MPGKSEAQDNAHRFKDMVPVCDNPVDDFHPRIVPRAADGCLHRVGDVRLRADQEFAGDSDHSFVGTTAGRRKHVGFGLVGDFDSDDVEVSIG